MTTPAPNLDLRREVYEALGWRIYRSSSKVDRWHNNDYAVWWNGEGEEPSNGVRPDAVDSTLPHIELDHGIALTELMRFCDHKLGWRIEETDDVRVMIFRRGMIVNQPLVLGSGKGATPALAICAALIAAAKVKS